MMKSRAEMIRTAAATPAPMPAFAPVLRPEDAGAGLVIRFVVSEDVDVCDNDVLAATLARPVDFALCVVAAPEPLVIAVEVG